MWMLLSLFQAQAGNMEISVSDPSVMEVQLNCEGRILKAPVVEGVARFIGSLGTCSVSLLSQVGQVQGNDKYTCGDHGCSKNAVEHLAVSNAPNRVTIILTDASTRLLELRCPSGYRERSPVNTNTAIFEGVPASEDCDLFWKNSAPGKGRKLRPGTWYCQNKSGTGVCQQR